MKALIGTVTISVSAAWLVLAISAASKIAIHAWQTGIYASPVITPALWYCVAITSAAIAGAAFVAGIWTVVSAIRGKLIPQP